LHVTVEYPVEEPTDSDDPTHIGFDVGESALIMGCVFKRDVGSQYSSAAVERDTFAKRCS
jgi:hypothetical protein